MVGKITLPPVINDLIRRVHEKPTHAAGIAAVVFALLLFLGYRTWQHNEQAISSDVKRVADMALISANAEKYFLDHDTLPENLPEMQGSPNPNPNFLRDEYLFDPETKHPFPYKVLGPRSYELCGDFHNTYVKDAGEAPYGVDDNSIWRHGAGHQCFKFFATRDPKAK